jgi:alpha-1,2-mannosyltransferase
MVRRILIYLGRPLKRSTSRRAGRLVRETRSELQLKPAAWQAEVVRSVPVAREVTPSENGARSATRRVIRPVALGVLLIVVWWWWWTLAIQSPTDDWAFDFRQFWQGAKDVVDGVSPYPSSALVATATDRLDPEGIREVFRFPYPAGAAVSLAPLGLLGFHTAAAVWSALLIVSLLGGVWLLGVRDWRVLAVVVTSAPVISSVRLGTFTPLLVLALAIAWRWRARRLVPGIAIGAAIALKLFVWPLAIWLAATRRWLEAAVATLFAAGVTLGAWAAIGFDGLSVYPELLRRLADVVADRGYSLVALGVELGLSRGLADVLPWVVGCALLGVCVLLARRVDGDRRAFVLAIVAALAFTPIIWLHYFTLLVVPLAVTRPRLSWVWLSLWVFWLTPVQENQRDLWRIALSIAIASAVAVSLRSRRDDSRLEAPS